MYKKARWQREKTWGQHNTRLGTKTKRKKWAATINCGDTQKCNKHDFNKRGLEK